MGIHPDPLVEQANAEARGLLTQKFRRGEEARVRLVNYRKDGRTFFNLLTTIPLTWEEGEMPQNVTPGRRYIVGFQADAEGLFR